MGRQLFVGNISYAAKDDDLRQAFEGEGVPVESAKVLMQGEDSRGFGFVTIGDTAEPDKVIEKMTGFLLKGRSLRVEHATPTKRAVRR